MESEPGQLEPEPEPVPEPVPEPALEPEPERFREKVSVRRGDAARGGGRPARRAESPAMASDGGLVSRQSETLLRVASVKQQSQINPFVNATPRPGIVEWTKMILLLPLALVRVVLALTLLLVGALFAYPSLWGYQPGPDANLPAPLSCWRKALFFPMRVATRGVLFCLGFMYIRVKGHKAPATEAPLLVPNHVGFVEPLFLMCRFGVSHVAKADTKKTPLMGALATAALQVFVRRAADDQPTPGDGTVSARDAAAAIAARANNMGANGYPTLCLYPEATTVNGKCLINFKTGAFRPGCPVQPCIIRLPCAPPSHPHHSCAHGAALRWVRCAGTAGSTRRCRRASAFTTGACSHSSTTYPHPTSSLRSGLCRSDDLSNLSCGQIMTVEFLPPVVPTEEEKQDAHKFAARVRSVMAEASGLPQTEHALADFFLMKSAQKFGTQNHNQTKPPNKWQSRCPVMHRAVCLSRSGSLHSVST